MSSPDHLSELDLLRGQVADLSRQLAERDRALQDSLEQSDLLRAIVEGTATETGEEFFASLVTHLTSVLKVQYAVIGEVEGDRVKKIRTLAVSAGGALVDNFEYELAHTPCATALTQTFAFFDRGVQATFPQFQRLVDLGAESYCAVPLRTKGGAVMGLLVVMDTKPLEQGDYLQSLLGVFAPRIAAEFERKRAEQERIQALIDLHNVIETIPDVVFALNTQGNLMKWNRRLEDVTGYSPEELLNKSALAFVPPEEQAMTIAAIQRAFTEGYAELDGHLLTKDLRAIPYHVTGALLRDSQGEPMGITGIGRDVSGKKRVEEVLRESEQRFALAVEGSTDILWDAQRLPGEPWYAPQTSIWWSPRVRELLGLQESESFETFEQWAARLHPDDKDRVFGQLAAHIEQRIPYDVEYRLRTNAGDYRWIRGRGQALWDEQGEPRRMSGSCQDITERKRTEELLRVSEERFRSILQHEPECVKTVAPDGTLLMMNPAGLSMIGARGEKEVIGQSVLSLIYPDDRAAFQQLQQAACSGASGALQFRIRTLQGEVRWMDTQSVPLREGKGEGKGEVTAVLSITRDITKRKQAEEALREMNLALANAMPGISRVGSDGRYLAVNEAYAGALGYDPSELIGVEAFRTVHPDDRPRMEAAAATMLREGKGEFEAVALRKDGSTFWEQALMVKIADPEGRYLGHHCFMRDITNRKQFEAMRARQYEALQANFNMTVALSRATSLEEVYEQGIDGVQRALKVDRASILLFDDDGVMRFKASRGLSKEYEQTVEGHSPWSREAVNPPTICVADIEEDPSVEAYREIFRGEGIRALGFIPLWSSDGLLGKFMLYYDSPHQFTEEEIQVAQTIAGHIAFMIQRKRAETALARREEGLRIVLESLPVGVWFSDAQGKMVLCNPAAREIWTGVKQVSMSDTGQNMQWWEQTGPLAEPHRWALTRALVKGEASLNDVLEIACQDGSRKIIRNSAVPVRGTDGVLLGAILVNEDITALRQAQEALRLTQFSIDHAVEGFLWIGPDARIVHVNEAACRMLEYTREELTAMTVHDIDANFPPEVWHSHWKELREQGSLTFESKHWSRTGRVLDTEVTVNYLQYEGKEYNCAIMRDIGVRKRADVALRASEERYRLLYDETPTMYFTLATDGTVRSVNRFGAEQLGYQVEELVGHSVLGLFHKQDKETVAASLSDCLATPEITRYWEFRKLRKDGSMMWVRETVRVGQSSTGETVVLVSCEDITARKQAEEALCVSEERLNLATRGSNTGIWDWDLETNEVYFSSIWKSMLGYEEHEFRGEFSEWDERIHPDDRARARVTVRAYLDGTTPQYELEHRLRHKDGSYRWILARGVTLSDARGVPYRMAGSHIDITERKQAEEALRLSEERFRAVFENAAVGIAVGSFTTGTGVDQVNPVFAAMLGYTPEELCLLGMKGITFPDDFPASREHVSQLIGGTRSHGTIEKRYVKKDGSLIWAQTTVSNILDKQGNYLHSIALIQDITERKQAEEALRKKDLELQYYFTSALDLLCIADVTGHFKRINKAWELTMGYSLGELEGANFLDYVHPDDLEATLYALGNLAEQKEVLGFVNRYRRKDGSYRWIEWKSIPAGELIYAAARDITERICLEETLRQQERDLRAAIEDRERISQDLHDGILQSLFAVGLAIESAKLSMTPKNLKTSRASLNQAIDQLNNVMHEIRNFIAGLGTDLLQGKDLPMALQHMLASLTEHQPTRVSLAVEDRAAKALSTEQSLHLIRVIQEAVSNCIKHGHAQEARVSLKMLKQGVRLSIRDNGRGFNQDAAKRTGHGLANMAARAQKIGGRFTILSKVNEGTSIVLDFPKEAADVSR